MSIPERLSAPSRASEPERLIEDQQPDNDADEGKRHSEPDEERDAQRVEETDHREDHHQQNGGSVPASAACAREESSYFSAPFHPVTRRQRNRF